MELAVNFDYFQNKSSNSKQPRSLNSGFENQSLKVCVVSKSRYSLEDLFNIFHRGWILRLCPNVFEAMEKMKKKATVLKRQ